MCDYCLSHMGNSVFCVATLTRFLKKKTYYHFLLLCRMFTFGSVCPCISQGLCDLCFTPLVFCNLCGTLTKGRGLLQYTQLYVTSRSIKMFPRFPLYLHFSHSPSLSLIHICSASNPSNAVSLCSPHLCHLPSLSVSLPLPLHR